MRHGASHHARARHVSGADGVHVVGDYRVRTVTTGTWREHCYVVRHASSPEAVVIDPGEDADGIAAALEAEGAVVAYVLLTHAHYDHVGALAAVCGASGAPFYVHPGDTKLLRRAPVYAMSFEKKALRPPGEGRDVTAAALTLGGRPIRTLHVPGHSEGGMAYGLDGVAFTGDTLLREHIGRVDLPGGDARRLRDSVTRLLEWLPEDTLLLAGHGRPWTAREARAWWPRAEAAATS
jgi:hydroxyacylglutathione hydrolase